MSTMKDVSLLIENGTSPDKKQVTVKGTLQFGADDIGKTHRLEITLVGEDKLGDQLPPGDAVGNDDLYTFTWGSTASAKPYRQIVATSTSPQTFTETRSITAKVVDEDPGMVVVGPPWFEIHLPRLDEVFARVTLSAVSATARSATVTTGSV